MKRNKYILYGSFILLVILIAAFALQIRKLQQQWRTSVRVIPGESKSRETLDRDQLDQDAATSAMPEILVKFRAGVSEESISKITGRFNHFLRDEIEAVPGLTTIDDPANNDANTLAAQYRALPEVEYAEPNYEIGLDETSDIGKASQVKDAQGANQWADISAPQAWATTKGSRQIVVGVLDSGVEYSHARLTNNMWSRPATLGPYQDRDLGTIDDVRGYNALLNDGEPSDENGHGTSCAGIIGAECSSNSGPCGVNWKIQIMPLKFLNAGGFGSVHGAVTAINYAINRKRAGINVRIISVGWNSVHYSRALEDVIRAAGDVEILFVASAGSTGNNNDVHPQYPAGYDLPNIINVAATDRNDNLAQFSNYGLKSVSIAAPGQEIVTTALGNDFEERSGTDVAASVVAGVAALTLSARPDLSLDQLRSKLLASIDLLSGLQGKVSTAGRINAAKAVSR